MALTFFFQQGIFATRPTYTSAAANWRTELHIRSVNAHSTAVSIHRTTTRSNDYFAKHTIAKRPVIKDSDIKNKAKNLRTISTRRTKNEKSRWNARLIKVINNNIIGYHLGWWQEGNVVDLCTGLAAAKNALSHSRTQEIYCNLATERIDAWPPLTMSNAGKWLYRTSNTGAET